jgi:hypothetical protein
VRASRRSSDRDCKLIGPNPFPHSIQCIWSLTFCLSFGVHSTACPSRLGSTPFARQFSASLNPFPRVVNAQAGSGDRLRQGSTANGDSSGRPSSFVLSAPTERTGVLSTFLRCEESPQTGLPACVLANHAGAILMGTAPKCHRSRHPPVEHQQWCCRHVRPGLWPAWVPAARRESLPGSGCSRPGFQSA